LAITLLGDNTAFARTPRSQVTALVTVDGRARIPCPRKIVATLRAIQASPAAVGCKPSWARWNFQCPVSGSMMITCGSASLAAVTIAWSVRSADETGPDGGEKTVSTAIRARGASTRIRSIA
jgi:hypothetical protein